MNKRVIEKTFRQVSENTNTERHGEMRGTALRRGDVFLEIVPETVLRPNLGDGVCTPRQGRTLSPEINLDVLSKAYCLQHDD